ncbi:DNA-binding transcriptional MerR regulator [Actinokineospora baliensis]|uniref:MerR family transcriptional regulator n=1 Tax=Actinokineospora baliensis TaxID=547056 RepID=UPI0027DCD8E2|nr:MerR family transcriptional regulator [Actinokineospora baliensis]MBM7770120.1 DNA-binding transcriptional MerR regulator [Actinokineospora baliensis]
MRIGELSKRTGVAVPTIKYYLREGMVPPGERTSPNQARYDEGHVHRLRLVRALIEVGRLPVAKVREVLGAVDTPAGNVDKLLGTVQKAVLPAMPENAEPEIQTAAEQEVTAMTTALGWCTPDDHPATSALAATLVTAQALGHTGFLDLVRRYALIAEQIGVADLDYIADHPGIDGMLEKVVVGTVLGDTALLALRRLAQAAESTKRYPDETGG